MEKRTVVTGGAGFIGSNLVIRLLDLEHEVLVIDNLCVGKREHLPHHERLRFVEGDITDGALLAKELRTFGPQVVIHLAALAFIPFCTAHPLETVKVNMLGTQTLLEHCQGLGLEGLFFASSAAVYPPQDGPNREDSPLGPIEIYGISKAIGEKLCELFCRQTGTKTVIGRFFNIYGPNDTNPFVIPEIVRQVRAGRRQIVLGNAQPKRDFVFVSDAAQAVLALLEQFEGRFGVFNIGAGREQSIMDVVECMERIIGEKIEVLQEGIRVRKVERMHLLADARKIHEAIGWSPQVTVEMGLRELLR